MHIWDWENEDLKHWYCVTILSHCQLVSHGELDPFLHKECKMPRCWIWDAHLLPHWVQCFVLGVCLHPGVIWCKLSSSATSIKIEDITQPISTSHTAFKIIGHFRRLDDNFLTRGHRMDQNIPQDLQHTAPLLGKLSLPTIPHLRIFWMNFVD